MTSALAKSPVDHEEAMSKLVAQRGQKFDPVVIDSFEAIGSDIAAIAKTLVDTEEDIERRQAPAQTD